MAAQEAEPDERFTTVDPNPSTDDDDEPETVKLTELLEQGEDLTGIVLEDDSDAGDYNGRSVVRADDGEVVPFWHNGQTRRAFSNASVTPGSEVQIIRTNEVRSFENDDGETVEYDVFTVGVAE